MLSLNEDPILRIVIYIEFLLQTCGRLVHSPHYYLAISRIGEKRSWLYSPQLFFQLIDNFQCYLILLFLQHCDFLFFIYGLDSFFHSSLEIQVAGLEAKLHISNFIKAKIDKILVVSSINFFLVKLYLRIYHIHKDPSKIIGFKLFQPNFGMSEQDEKKGPRVLERLEFFLKTFSVLESALLEEEATSNVNKLFMGIVGGPFVSLLSLVNSSNLFFSWFFIKISSCHQINLDRFGQMILLYVLFPDEPALTLNQIKQLTLKQNYNKKNNFTLPSSKYLVNSVIKKISQEYATKLYQFFYSQSCPEKWRQILSKFDFIIIVSIMSQPELPIIQQLRQQQEEAATRMSEQFKEKDRQNSSTTKNGQSSQEVLQSDVQVRLQIKEEKAFTKSENIFANKSQKENKVNIFSNSKSVNLFSIGSSANPKSVNIFATLSNKDPLIESNDEGLSEQNNADNEQKLNKEQQLPEAAVKQMKYEYENKTQKLTQFKLIRFKSGVGATKEGVVLSIEKDTDANQINILYFFLRNEATKVIVYNAFVPKNTKTENFMGKMENIKMAVIKAKKEEQKVAAEREIVKLQFENEEESKRFQSVLSTFFSDSPN